MVVRDQSIVIIKHEMQTELILRLQKYFPISRKINIKNSGTTLFCAELLLFLILWNKLSYDDVNLIARMKKMSSKETRDLPSIAVYIYLMHSVKNNHYKLDGI